MANQKREAEEEAGKAEKESTKINRETRIICFFVLFCGFSCFFTHSENFKYVNHASRYYIRFSFHRVGGS